MKAKNKKLLKRIQTEIDDIIKGFGNLQTGLFEVEERLDTLCETGNPVEEVTILPDSHNHGQEAVPETITLAAGPAAADVGEQRMKNAIGFIQNPHGHGPSRFSDAYNEGYNRGYEEGQAVSNQSLKDVIWERVQEARNELNDILKMLQ